jgi:curved DNA-binding protein
VDFKDYYKVLGVPKGAGAKEIKAAYRKLARKFHPDVNPGNAKAEARFKEINEAHEVLSDPAKRRRYDQLGADWAQYGPARRQPHGPGFRVNVGGFDAGNLGGFSDFFKVFFGGGGFGSAFGERESPFEAFESEGGASAEQPVELTLEEVLRGATRTFRMAGPGGERTVEVKIPPGVRDGARVRVAGEGRKGRAGAQGDLYLRVRIAPHPRFERKDADLETSAAVAMTTAVLGGTVEVQTLDGSVEIKVPEATPSGRVFRLRGRGLPRQEAPDQRGDLRVTLQVELPRKIGRRERELLEELRSLGH